MNGSPTTAPCEVVTFRFTGASTAIHTVCVYMNASGNFSILTKPGTIVNITAVKAKRTKQSNYIAYSTVANVSSFTCMPPQLASVRLTGTTFTTINGEHDSDDDFDFSAPSTIPRTSFLPLSMYNPAHYPLPLTSPIHVLSIYVLSIPERGTRPRQITCSNSTHDVDSLQ